MQQLNHNQILNMWAEGITATDIAALVGANPDSIRKIAAKHRARGDQRAYERKEGRVADWTEEQVAELKRMWAEGWSAQKIADALGGGVTRNAVIGKKNRLGLPGRQTGISANRRPNKRRNPYDRRARLMQMPRRETRFHSAPLPDEPVSLSMTIMDLTNKACRWPHGEGPYTFCGHRQAAGSSYCEFHDGVARNG